VLARLAVEQRDGARELEYGPMAIDGGSDDPRLLEHVSQALLARDDPESLAKALKYATRLAEKMRDERKSQLESKSYEPGQGKHLDETDVALRNALVYVSRAQAKLGKNEEALKAADEAWQAYPSLDSALERAYVLERLGRYAEALDATAEAFVIEDDRTTGKDRQRAREQMAGLATKANVSDPSVRVLPAWDRTRALLDARLQRLREFDPNSTATSPMDFTLSKLDGGRLPLSSMKGKVVVLDFWATWCGPCRIQHPLYEQVKTRFKDNPNVVFLAVNTDEDHSLVKPFLDGQKWSQDVVYEDGLAGYFRVSSIPTTIVLDRSGELKSRMPGFIAERFVEMLSERINSALATN
jgi:thiol-disulfide isomerase/thioredoxin